MTVTLEPADRPVSVRLRLAPPNRGSLDYDWDERMLVVRALRPSAVEQVHHVVLQIRRGEREPFLGLRRRRRGGVVASDAAEDVPLLVVDRESPARVESDRILRRGFFVSSEISVKPRDDFIDIVVCGFHSASLQTVVALTRKGRAHEARPTSTPARFETAGTRIASVRESSVRDDAVVQVRLEPNVAARHIPAAGERAVAERRGHEQVVALRLRVWVDLADESSIGLLAVVQRASDDVPCLPVATAITDDDRVRHAPLAARGGAVVPDLELRLPARAQSEQPPQTGVHEAVERAIEESKGRAEPQRFEEAGHDPMIARAPDTPS